MRAAVAAVQAIWPRISPCRGHFAAPTSAIGVLASTAQDNGSTPPPSYLPLLAAAGAGMFGVATAADAHARCAGSSKKQYKRPVVAKYVPGMFEDVNTVEEFGDSVLVKKAAVLLAEPMEETCKKDGCHFPAVKRNRSKCVLHCQSYYPKEGERGEGLADKKGEGLAGVEFLRPEDRRRGCSCDYPPCRKLGYFPKADALWIPAEGRKTVLNTPDLFSSDKQEEFSADNTKDIFLYPWHWFPDHVERKGDKWNLKYDKDKKEIFRDLEGERYTFPPPRNIPKDFVDKHFSKFVHPKDRWKEEGDMPGWMWDMILIDDNNNDNIDGSRSAKKPTSAELERREMKWRKRAHQQADEMTALKNTHKEELAREKSRHASEIAKKDEIIRERDETIDQLKKEMDEIKAENKKIHVELRKARERKNQPLRFADLFGDGLLAKNVSAFTFFDTAQINNEFLELINFADGSEGSLPKGDGLCENLRSYKRVSWEERNGEVAPPSLGDKEWEKKLISIKAQARDGSMTWKDEYLAFCIYVRAGTTQEFAATLCGISTSRMSDIYRAWGNVLDDALCEMFPRPTRSQLLSAYPTRFYESNNDARVDTIRQQIGVSCYWNVSIVYACA